MENNIQIRMLSNGSIETSTIDNYNSINQIPCGLKTRLYIKFIYLYIHVKIHKCMNKKERKRKMMCNKY